MANNLNPPAQNPPVAQNHALPINFRGVTGICCMGAVERAVLHMAVIAERYPQLNVVVTDSNARLVRQWRNDRILLVEPGLEGLLRNLRNANLRFVESRVDAVRDSQIIFVGVTIPTKTKGREALSSLDLTNWDDTMRFIAEQANGSKIIVERSTMPLDTSRLSTGLLGRRQPGQPRQPPVEFAVFYIPDFSSPGQALEHVRNPNSLIIAQKSEVGNIQILRDMYSGLVNPEVIQVMHHVSAAIAKLASNAMESAKMSIINVISSICQRTGQDFAAIQEALGPNWAIHPTLGIGGLELLKDLQYLKGALPQYGLKSEGKLCDHIVRLGKRKREQFLDFLCSQMISFTEKRIAVFGLTYKGYLEDSVGLSVCKSLLREGALVRIFDPLTNAAAIRRSLGYPVRLSIHPSATEACERACAALFLVPNIDPLLFNFRAMLHTMRARPHGPHLFMVGDMQVNVDHMDRFSRDFGSEEVLDNEDEGEIPPNVKPNKSSKPGDFQVLFGGNSKDDFMVGIKFTMKSIKLYSDFYSSDTIVASAVGLLEKIDEAKINKENDVDYLSSIEVVIIDHADVITMQNWDFLKSVVEQLNHQPSQQHGTDIMPIRPWYLDGHASFYRQTILLSYYSNPDINNLFNKLCTNYHGKVKLVHEYKGVLPKVVCQVRQVFPKIKNSVEAGIMIFISSYFEYVRIWNFLKSRNASFCRLHEYAEQKIFRAHGFGSLKEGGRSCFTQREHIFTTDLRLLIWLMDPMTWHAPCSFLLLISSGLKELWELLQPREWCHQK